MMHTRTLSTLIVQRIILLAMFLLAWWLVALRLPAFILPGPEKTAQALALLWRNGTLPEDVGITLSRVAMGFGFATLVGTPLGLALGASRRLAQFFEPLLSVFNSVSSAIWAIFAIIWFGISNATTVFVVFMMLREKALLANSDLTCVRVVRMGSAPVSASLLAQIRRLLPAARIINAYGTTEGGPVVFGPHPEGLEPPPLATGYPHPRVQVRLRAADGALSDYGVLEINSPALMQGYHQRPDITPPFTPDGYYRTGDVFRRDETGFYTFVGRHDDMFVCGGENIYPSEVEQLLERHPDVQQACVVPVEDEIKGAKPVAWVILRPGRQCDEASLKAFALTHGAAYLHPRCIWLLDRFPLAGTNKIDRSTLKAEAARRMQTNE